MTLQEAIKSKKEFKKCTTWYKRIWEECKNIHKYQTKGGNNE